MEMKSEPVLMTSRSKISEKASKKPKALVAWFGLNVTVSGIKQGKRVILSNVTGEVEKGDILAILGPSGAGKTTLLNCIAGRRKPDKGHILHNACRSVAYVPQTDYFFEYLTVYESLVFALTFKKDQNTKSSPEQIVDKCVENFQLDKCKDTKVWMCSGGERKRLSIALEAMSQVDLLVLDEPTTGLDSFTATKCLETLRKMCKNEVNQTTIIATIHQPTSQLLNLLDRIYLLGNGGCLYDGPSAEANQHLSMCRLATREFSNPMDLMVKIAAGHEGSEALEKLREVFSSKQREYGKVESQPLTLKDYKRPLFSAVKIHIKRFATEFYRRKFEALILFLIYVFPPLVATSLFTSFETHRGCLYLVQENGRTLQETPYELLERRLNDEGLLIYIYFTNTVCFLAGVGHAAVIFPHYVKAFEKEYGNEWYTLASFFIGFLVVSLAWHTICATASSLCIIQSLSIQFDTFEKLTFVSLFVLTACISNVFAILITILFYNHQLVVLMMVIGLCFMQQLLSTILIKFKYMEPAIQLLSNFSAIRFVMEALISLVFPYSSCSIQDTTTLNFSQIINLVRYYRVKVNTKIEQIENIPLKTLEVFNNQSWTAEEVGEFLKNFNHENDVSDLKEFWQTGMNYILDGYEMNTVDVNTNFLILICMFLVANFTCYVSLFIRSAKLRH